MLSTDNILAFSFTDVVVDNRTFFGSTAYVLAIWRYAELHLGGADFEELMFEGMKEFLSLQVPDLEEIIFSNGDNVHFIWCKSDAADWICMGVFNLTNRGF